MSKKVIHTRLIRSLVMLFVSFGVCVDFSRTAHAKSSLARNAGSDRRPCSPNPDPLYDRSQVLNEVANILNDSIPEYSQANTKGFYVDSESGIGFFVVDLTKPSNRYRSLSDCVDLINGHIYHVAPLRSHYSLSHIVILEEGRLKVFRSVNCPKRGDRLEDAIKYVSARLSNDKKRNQIINRIRHYKRYGYYYAMDHASFICNKGR